MVSCGHGHIRGHLTCANLESSVGGLGINTEAHKVKAAAEAFECMLERRMDWQVFKCGVVRSY